MYEYVSIYIYIAFSHRYDRKEICNGELPCEHQQRFALRLRQAREENALEQGVGPYAWIFANAQSPVCEGRGGLPRHH